MPSIQIVGPEEKHDVILRLLKQTKTWVASVKALEVEALNVRTKYVTSIQEETEKYIEFYVQELFTVSFSGTIRTPQMCQNLHQAIKKGFNEFVVTEKFDMKPKNATVVIRMVDRSKWEYSNWNIPD